LFDGAVVVVTDATMGKSTWLCMVRCARLKVTGWRSAVFSPEMPTLPPCRNTFAESSADAAEDDAVIDAAHSC